MRTWVQHYVVTFDREGEMSTGIPQFLREVPEEFCRRGLPAFLQQRVAVSPHGELVVATVASGQEGGEKVASRPFDQVLYEH